MGPLYGKKETDWKTDSKSLTCALCLLATTASWLLEEPALLGENPRSGLEFQDDGSTAGIVPAVGYRFCMVSCNQAVVILRSWAVVAYYVVVPEPRPTMRPDRSYWTEVS